MKKLMLAFSFISIFCASVQASDLKDAALVVRTHSNWGVEQASIGIEFSGDDAKKVYDELKLSPHSKTEAYPGFHIEGINGVQMTSKSGITQCEKITKIANGETQYHCFIKDRLSQGDLKP